MEENDISEDSEVRVYQLVTGVMSFFVNDLVHQTHQYLEKLSISSVSDIYSHKNNIAQFSKESLKMSAQLKEYLYAHFYNADEVMRYNENGKKIIDDLFTFFYKNTHDLPENFYSLLKTEEKHIIIKDYIAGMTDSFAIHLHKDLIK